jgi:aspartyl-tRNA(Asn)/glutamyl-tRNA(Gln) amidotransferase subunit B
MATATDSGVGAAFEAVIGLEVHCQLKTRSKLFCACPSRFGDLPNANVCPVCLGLPGALPVLNRDAVSLAIRAALATGCRIHETSIFARKNYFYPDLPKGYQISQYERPLATGGSVEIAPGRAVRIERIHMEEDAGKLLHEGFPWSGEKSGVDLNRAGVPLIEIVSAPDLRGPDEAFQYLSALKAILVYADVSDGNMEEGSLRCDANVSIRPRGARELSTRVEIKNLNSFNHVRRALQHEIARQQAVVTAGGRVEQETRLWSADRAETQAMRGKEDAHDYRYFPDPDLPPLVVTPEWVERERQTLPELPAARRARLASQYGLPDYDAGVLTAERELADYFEAAVRAGSEPKAASNWVMTEVLRKLKLGDAPIAAAPVPAEALASLLRLVDAGAISGKIAKDVFEKMWQSGEPPDVIVEREGLRQVSDEAAIENAVAEVIAASADQVASYRAGRTAALGWFVGQVMKRMGGRANPQVVNRIVKQALGTNP